VPRLHIENQQTYRHGQVGSNTVRSFCPSIFYLTLELIFVQRGVFIIFIFMESYLTQLRCSPVSTTSRVLESSYRFYDFVPSTNTHTRHPAVRF
jgi:hypothetical protein